ncbi:hypothetical protein [uncultured Lutibacter sp.]|uniref:hypothetical protein n=1 Tax=uncultured Lutibacter sp. TaxID=437739 RepID=UPI0026367A38|nr:hypothetical protein [uncultured Lutibacter sp.]
MKKENHNLDLSIIDNQLLVSKNWSEYKDKIILPEIIRIQIDSILKDYTNYLITNAECSNQICDLIHEHFSKNSSDK